MSTISSRFGEFTISNGASSFTVNGPSFSATFDYDSLSEVGRASAFTCAVNAVNSHIKDLADAERSALHQATNTVLVQISTQQQATNSILTQIATDIDAIRARCENEELGILTRHPYNGWGTGIHRAMAVAALRTNGLLDKVVHEASNPTPLPGDQ